jgi:hypothetical protein
MMGDIKEVDEQKQKNGFHLNPEVSVGDLVIAITIIVPMVAWGIRTESRISVLEYQATQNMEIFKEIKDTLVRVEGKIDGKADKRNLP